MLNLEGLELIETPYVVAAYWLVAFTWRERKYLFFLGLSLSSSTFSKFLRRRIDFDSFEISNGDEVWSVASSVGLSCRRRLVSLVIVDSVEISNGDDVWCFSLLVDVLLQFCPFHHREGSDYFILLFPWIQFLRLESKILFRWWDVTLLLFSSLCLSYYIGWFDLNIRMLLSRFQTSLLLKEPREKERYVSFCVSDSVSPWSNKFIELIGFVGTP